jgi:hypothetical protein
LEGIAILNIPSYAGGTNPWGEVDKKKARKKSKKAKCNGKDDNDWAEQGTVEFSFCRRDEAIGGDNTSLDGRAVKGRHQYE